MSRSKMAVYSYIMQEAERMGIDPRKAAAVAEIESGLNPRNRTGSYKGIFQLSNKEFNKYGGGNIYDMKDNVRAGLKKFQHDTNYFKKRYGRDPSANELYMHHQQGWGGAARHLGNPSGSAIDNMWKTAEGRQKGRAWARKAILGNMTPEMRRKYGDNPTSAQFMEGWDARVNRGIDRVARKFGGGNRMALGANVPHPTQKGDVLDVSNEPEYQNLVWDTSQKDKFTVQKMPWNPADADKFKVQPMGQAAEGMNPPPPEQAAGAFSGQAPNPLTAFGGNFPTGLEGGVVGPDQGIQMPERPQSNMGGINPNVWTGATPQGRHPFQSGAPQTPPPLPQRTPGGDYYNQGMGTPDGEIDRPNALMGPGAADLTRQNIFGRGGWANDAFEAGGGTEDLAHSNYNPLAQFKMPDLSQTNIGKMGSGLNNLFKGWF